MGVNKPDMNDKVSKPVTTYECLAFDTSSLAFVSLSSPFIFVVIYSDIREDLTWFVAVVLLIVMVP